MDKYWMAINLNGVFFLYFKKEIVIYKHEYIPTYLLPNILRLFS